MRYVEKNKNLIGAFKIINQNLSQKILNNLYQKLISRATFRHGSLNGATRS